LNLRLRQLLLGFHWQGKTLHWFCVTCRVAVRPQSALERWLESLSRSRGHALNSLFRALIRELWQKLRARTTLREPLDDHSAVFLLSAPQSSMPSLASRLEPWLDGGAQSARWG